MRVDNYIRDDVFVGKNSHFYTQISDDLFLVIDQVFSDFFYLFQIFHIFALLNVMYDPFFTRKSPISENNYFLDDTFFLLCSYFRAHPTTLLLKILGGGRMHGPSPTSIFGGPSPQSPYRPPPMSRPICLHRSHHVGYTWKLDRCSIAYANASSLSHII